MSDTGTLRAIYLDVLERTPEPLRPGVKLSAACVRHARRGVRRARHRVARRLEMPARRTTLVVRRTPLGRRVLRALDTAAASERFAGVRFRLFRPYVRIPDTSFIVIDASGLPAADALAMLSGVTGRSVVLITDDPYLGTVRSEGLIYEYVPASAVASGALAAQGPRMRNFRRSYGVEAVERIEAFLPGAGNTD